MTNNPPSTRIQPGEYGYPLKLKARYDNFIGGDWVAPADGEYYQNLTPVTGQPLCEVASSGKKDIDLALDAAHKAKDKWAHTSVQDRAAILFKIADRMEQNLELLATAETWDNGKPIRETSAADVPLAIDHFRYFASCIRAQEGGISEVDSETVAYHFHEPLGVVGQIIPWNFPLLMASWKMAPALAAGNCVVLKPARLTPLSVLLLMEVIGDLLPPGVVNVVNGAGGEIGEYLATSKRIAKVAFTGSTEVGQQIMQYATQNIIPVTLELGGKSPNIFFADVMDEEDAFLIKRWRGLLYLLLTRARCVPVQAVHWSRNPSMSALWSALFAGWRASAAGTRLIAIRRWGRRSLTASLRLSSIISISVKRGSRYSDRRTAQSAGWRT